MYLVRVGRQSHPLPNISKCSHVHLRIGIGVGRRPNIKQQCSHVLLSRGSICCFPVILPRISMLPLMPTPDTMGLPAPPSEYWDWSWKAAKYRTMFPCSIALFLAPFKVFPVILPTIQSPCFFLRQLPSPWVCMLCPNPSVEIGDGWRPNIKQCSRVLLTFLWPHLQFSPSLLGQFFPLRHSSFPLWTMLTDFPSYQRS